MKLPKSVICGKIDRAVARIVQQGRDRGLSDEHIRERVAERLDRALAA